MKKIILSLLAIVSVSLVNAQINVQNTDKVTINRQNPFLDASDYVSFNNSVGKGLYFPRTDLTQWEFKTDLMDGISNFVTGFDGMIVYNTGSGMTKEDVSVAGKRVDVEPGFYYFSNPTIDTSLEQGDASSIAKGQWIRLADVNPDAKIRFWSVKGNADITQPTLSDTFTITNADVANFIGTTDANNVTVATNSVARLEIGEKNEVTVGDGKFNFVLDVYGKARFRKGIVTAASTYPDYVFDNYFTGKSDINPTYKFKKLDEVEAFIKENNHLPGVTKIDDLTKTENGYEVDNTQLSVQTLEKVEELYLHVIEQQKEIQALKAEIAELKK